MIFDLENFFFMPSLRFVSFFKWFFNEPLWYYSPFFLVFFVVMKVLLSPALYVSHWLLGSSFSHRARGGIGLLLELVGFTKALLSLKCTVYFCWCMAIMTVKTKGVQSLCTCSWDILFYCLYERRRPLSVYMRFYLTLKSSIILHFDRTKT